jgi:hypothetical protein
MTNKEIVQDLLRRIPDDASLQDIARELEFIAAVRQGLSELDNGNSIPSALANCDRKTKAGDPLESPAGINMKL